LHPKFYGDKERMADVRGKSIQAVVKDIAEGYTTVNPIFLKSFNQDQLKNLSNHIRKIQTEIRSIPFPAKDIPAIRMRNMKLQRLHTAIIIINNFAKERRISI